MSVNIKTEQIKIGKTAEMLHIYSEMPGCMDPMAKKWINVLLNQATLHGFPQD